MPSDAERASLPYFVIGLTVPVLLDLYSRRVIGWAMSAKPDQHLAIEAWQMALVSRRPHQGLIHHTDQGATYTRNTGVRDCSQYESEG